MPPGAINAIRGLILMTESLVVSLVSVLFGIEQLTQQLIIRGTLIIVALVVIQFNEELLKSLSYESKLGKSLKNTLRKFEKGNTSVLSK